MADVMFFGSPGPHVDRSIGENFNDLIYKVVSETECCVDRGFK